MKSNEIIFERKIEEGPADFFRRQKAGFSAYKASTADAKALSNIENDFASREARDKTGAMKAWQDHFARIPNKIEVAKNPQVYYKELTNFLTQRYKTAPNVQAPTDIDNANVQSFIAQFSKNYFTPKKQAAIAAIKPKTAKEVPIGGEPAATEPAATTPAATEPAATTPAATEPAASPTGTKTTPAWAANQTWRNTEKLAPGVHKTPTTGKPTAAPASKPAEPPTAAPAAATTPTAGPAAAPAAKSTLPTKDKSNVKSKDIDIDAALKMADALSTEEKKKLLQDLLKSGVTVKAGGA